MKTNSPDGDDASLNALLQAWKSKLSLPPGFREQVWQRIDRAETASVPAAPLAQLFVNWLSTRLPRPALATAYLAVLLVVGVGVGWTRARQETSRVAVELGVRYAQSVDPYRSAP